MKHIYLYYQGQYYDIGTVVKIKTRWDGIKEATFRGWKPQGCTFLEDGITDNCYWFETEKYIVEVVKPVYPQDLVQIPDNRNMPAPWDVEIGWIWYIIVMVVGTIFQDRLLIWVFATAVFFLWKNGKLGGKK